jgi:hypothetical protein
VYLETKFASLMSCGLTVELLAEILPLANQINMTSVRHKVQQVAARIRQHIKRRIYPRSFKPLSSPCEKRRGRAVRSRVAGIGPIFPRLPASDRPRWAWRAVRCTTVATEPRDQGLVLVPGDP